MHRSVLLAGVAAVLLSAAARAEEKGHKVAITVAPLLLLDTKLSDGSHSLLVELTGEYRLPNNFAADVILGGGRTVTGDGLTVPEVEVGAQGIYYLLGGFNHGLQLGVEALYLHASAESGTITASSAGLAAGGFLGYKVAADFGLTFNVQAGAAYLAASASGSDSASSATVHETPSTVLPILRINLGWSF